MDWTDWRRQLAELRRALDAHLDAADALAARASGVDRTDTIRPPSTTPTPAPAGGSSEVTRALAHLAANCEHPLNLAELARVAGCSRDRLARLVRRETGLSVHAHLMRLRLARAAREVRAGDKIEAVMLGVGYRGKRNFYRQFKARFGTTPGRYRLEAERRGQ